MKFWRNAAALLSVFHPETTHTGNHSTHKDVKNEGRSDYIYENKARATKCHAKNTAFYTKMHPLRGNRQQSSGPFGRLCTNCTTIRGEMTPATVVALFKKLRVGDAEDLPTSSTLRMMGSRRVESVPAFGGSGKVSPRWIQRLRSRQKVEDAPSIPPGIPRSPS